MFRFLLGAGAGFVLATWVIPALRGTPKPGELPEVVEGEPPSIHRITGDMINAFDEIKPLLYQIHVDSADGSMSVQDWTRAARQLQISGVI